MEFEFVEPVRDRWCSECRHAGHGKFFHGFLGKIATVGDLPLIVGLDKNGAGETEQGFPVGKDSDDVGPAFEFPVESFQRVIRLDLTPMGLGEVRERGHIGCRVEKHGSDSGKPVSE